MQTVRKQNLSSLLKISPAPTNSALLSHKTQSPSSQPTKNNPPKEPQNSSFEAMIQNSLNNLNQATKELSNAPKESINEPSTPPSNEPKNSEPKNSPSSVATDEMIPNKTADKPNEPNANEINTSEINTSEINADKNSDDEALTDKIPLDMGDLMAILSVLEASLGGEKTSSFPNLSNGLEKILKIDKNIAELKGAKNLAQLLNIAQKLGLDISKITISKETAQKVVATHPKLAKSGFFAPLANAHITKSAPKTEQKPAPLNELLQKPANIKTTNEPAKTAKEPHKMAISVATETTKNIDSDEPAKPLKPAKMDAETPKPNIKKIEPNAPKEPITPKEPAILDGKPAAILTEPSAKKDELRTPKPAAKIEQKPSQKPLDEPKQEPIKQEMSDKPAQPKPAQSANIANPQPAIKDTVVADYLANLMQRAIKEVTTPEPPANSVATGLSNSPQNNSQNSPQSGSQNSSQNQEQPHTAAAAAKSLNETTKLNIKTAQLNRTFESFASELSQKAQQLKSPITRFHMTLNPSNLGEVEVTLISRGQSLHVSFGSNTQTMNLFMQHQNEFKNSLLNIGFEGLSMNFSEHQKEQQHQRERFKNGDFNADFENALSGEEISEHSVIAEIVVPKYF